MRQKEVLGLDVFQLGYDRFLKNIPKEEVIKNESLQDQKVEDEEEESIMDDEENEGSFKQNWSAGLSDIKSADSSFEAYQVSKEIKE